MNNPLQNWIPYKLSSNETAPACHWLNSFEEPFSEPFFSETVLKCKALRARPFDSVSNLAVLEQWAEDIDYVKPTAFIFHISRCGSTLVSQLLGLDDQNICLSEVPFFDDILRLPLKNPDWIRQQAGHLFTVALKYYAQKRRGTENRLFIKTDSWHIFFYEQIQALFPDTPFILLYRSPAEVLRSHSKQRGMQAVPGLIEPELFGFEPAEAFNPDLDVYTAKVLERYFERYLEIARKDEKALLLNYNQGPMQMIESIADFTGLAINNDILRRMQERSGYHSKRPGEVFAEKETQYLPEFLKQADDLYRDVDALRLALV